jgi:isopenicillin N synthase-like dioxygenase
MMIARKKIDHQDDGMCQEVGLLWSGDHGVSLELGRQLKAHAQAFFNLPMEHKDIRNQRIEVRIYCKQS